MPRKVRPEVFDYLLNPAHLFEEAVKNGSVIHGSRRNSQKLPTRQLFSFFMEYKSHIT